MPKPNFLVGVPYVRKDMWNHWMCMISSTPRPLFIERRYFFYKKHQKQQREKDWE